MASENQWNDNAEDRHVAPRRFGHGDRARDRDSDDGSEVLVLFPEGKTAEASYISAIGKTVAEANPDYPDDDPVFSVAFVEGIEDALGVDWEPDDVLDLAERDELDRAQIKTYAYPESRLEPIGDERDGESGDMRPDGGENTTTNVHGDEVPVRCEPADFGGGEASGMDEL